MDRNQRLYTSAYDLSNIFLGSAASGCLALTLTQLPVIPWDIAVASTSQRGFKEYRSALKRNYSRHGIYGVTKGWNLSIAGNLLLGWCRFGTYELVRRMMEDRVDASGSRLKRDLVIAASVGIGDVIGITIQCPFETLRMNMIFNPFKSSIGLEFERIVLRDGFFSLWRTLQKRWIYHIPQTMVNFVAFSHISEMLIMNSPPTSSSPRPSNVPEIYRPHAPKFLETFQRKSKDYSIVFLSGFAAGTFTSTFVSIPLSTMQHIRYGARKFHPSGTSGFWMKLKTLGRSQVDSFTSATKVLKPNIVTFSRQVLLMSTFSAFQWTAYGLIRDAFNMPLPGFDYVVFSKSPR